jgi:hypothetical protein
MPALNSAHVAASCCVLLEEWFNQSIRPSIKGAEGLQKGFNMKEPTRDGNYLEAGIGRLMDLDSEPDVGIGRRKKETSRDPLARSEEDNIPRRKGGRRKGGWVNARPAKQTMNDLTCSEADVDELLSAGERT